MSAIVSFVNALRSEPVHVAIAYSAVAAAGVAVTILAIGLVIDWVRDQYFPIKHRDGRSFRDVFNKHRKDREDFWRYFEQKYTEYRRDTFGIPDTLREVVHSAKLPSTRSPIGIWIRNNKGTWSKSTQDLFNFALSFYPAGRSGSDDLQAHQHRALQAKFWDCWAKRSSSYTYREVRKAAQDNFASCKLLYFLELAQDLQKDKMTEGKSGLYGLMLEICRKS